MAEDGGLGEWWEEEEGGGLGRCGECDFSLLVIIFSWEVPWRWRSVYMVYQ